MGKLLRYHPDVAALYYEGQQVLEGLLSRGEVQAIGNELCLLSRTSPPWV